MEPLSRTRDAYKLVIIRAENIYAYRLLYAAKFAHKLLTDLIACITSFERRRQEILTNE